MPAPPVAAPLRRRNVARLLALARPRWRQLALGCVFLALGSAMGLAYPQLIRALIDDALVRRSRQAVDRAALSMLAVFFVEGVATGLRYLTFTQVGERVVTDLRQQLYGRLLAADIAFFDRSRTGELLSRLGSDTALLQSAVSVNISMTLRSLASVLGGVGLLLFTSPRLTFVMLLVVPAVALGAALFGRRVRGLARAGQDALARAGDVAQETLGAMRTVRAFAQEAAEARRYGRAVEAAFALGLARIRVVAAFSAGATFCAYGAMAVVLWYGGRLVLEGRLSVGALTAFLLYTLIVAFSLGTLGGLWTDLMRALGATERVFELLEGPEAGPPGARPAAPPRGAVRLEAVHFAYPSRPAVPVLQAVSFSMEPGEVVALVGPSGSGKSTVAALLLRLYALSEGGGAIFLDGTDLRELDADWLRAQVGSVAQEPVLFSTTIADNIRYGRPEADLEAVRAAARLAYADGFIEAFPEGYQTQVGERGVQLSGGQKQRVAIARAALKDPRLLLLDEATSALDTESEHLVQQALDALMRGRTTLVIAHRLSTVRRAQRVLVLDGGVLVQAGSHAELMAQPEGLYRRLVDRQF